MILFHTWLVDGEHALFTLTGLVLVTIVISWWAILSGSIKVQLVDYTPSDQSRVQWS